MPKAIYWLTYSLLLLFILSVIPPFTIGVFHYKKINLLADIEPDIVIVPKKDSIPDSTFIIPPPVVQHKIDTCKKNVTCIEDFSEDGTAMLSFIESLDKTKSMPIRIAFYGDSFIEGDILTSSLRDTLQSVFGGRGVGYVAITSEVAKFRTTVKHSFKNWQALSIISNYDTEPHFGIGGLSAIPLQDNEVEFSPGYGGRLNKFSLFYSSTAFRTLRYTVRDTITRDTTLYSYNNLNKFDLYNLRSSSIKLSIAQPDSLELYGVSIEDGNGLYVDNLAMRGNSGIALSRISNTMLRESNRLRPYKLVVLQFGLNVVDEKDSTDYAGYTQSMVRVVNKFKESFSDCSILIVSVSDRSNNQNGNFKTIPGILAMRIAQRKIAMKAGVAFWDLFAAMGGENSMPNFVNAKPSMAARDYTHVNFKGGKFIARKLSDALMYEQERYAKAKPVN